MKKLLLGFILCTFLSNIVIAQNSSINGVLVDTSSKEHLKNATVCLLQAKDSFLYRFTRVADDGRFAFKSLDSGKYILLISYPQYADYVQEVAVKGRAQIQNLGHLNLIQKAHLLKDVIVTQQLAAIRIKGDTTEYNASSFKVQANASVEDLLKKFPGIQVDKDGKITAQGKTVEKVLVDGEEFFGDDPTLVTRNLRADMVNKVQLYDKSSDQAAFTGIDDGNKKKTLNIVLKEDKKNGYFGKASVGVGTDKFYDAQGMFNRFKGKHKIAAYLTLSNTGRTGLGFDDAMQYASSGNMEFVGGGVVLIRGGGNDPLSSFSGQYDGKGIPDAKTGGIHYDNKWNKDKQGINLNYKIGKLSVEGGGKSTVQNNLPNATQINNTTNRFKNYIFRNKLDAVYDVKLDSTSSIKVTTSGSLAHNTSDNVYTSQTTKGLDTLINNNNRAINNEGDTKAFSGDVLWRKKFKKKGRTISLNLSEQVNNKTEEGYLKTTTNFYKNTAIDSTAIIDQLKQNNNKSTNFYANLSYTEPLTKSWNMVARYGFSAANTDSKILSYNRGVDSLYDALDQQYSNHYVFDQTAHNTALQFVYKKKKINLNFGSNVSFAKYIQKDVFADSTIGRNFINWSPSVWLRYKLNRQSNLNVHYYGNTQQPSMSQLQPIANNNDNLNLYIGNPFLKPAYSSRFGLNYGNFKTLGERFISFYGNYGFIVNPIVTNVTTDLSSGKNTYNYFNLNQSTTNYNLHASFGKKMTKLDLHYGFDLNLNGNKYINYINSIMNVTHSNNYGFSFRLNKSKENIFDITLTAGLGYATSNSNLDNQINNNAWNYNIHPNIDIFLPGKLQLHTDGDYIWQQQTQTFNTNYNRFLWNASIDKKFLKKENLLLKFSVDDILNQNIGFDRNVYNNTVSQSSYVTIQRYFMLSLIWKFSKMGPVEKNK